MSDDYPRFDPEPGAFSVEAQSAGLEEARCNESIRVPAGIVPQIALDMHRIAVALPLLGSVLWLCRPGGENTFPRARLTSPGVLLLEHPALAALADCTSVSVLCTVTTHGPREWLEFRDVHKAAIAKLYLLPETDYLAWDAMLAGCGVPSAAAAQRGWWATAALVPGKFIRRGSAWQARIARLPLLRLSCLSVLGLRAPEQVSAIGRRLAGTIVEDEHAVWCEG